MAPVSTLKNIVCIGGNSGPMGAALQWRDDPIPGYRMIMIEEKSHYNFVFAFPRAAVISGFEKELFIPYSNMFYGNDTLGKVVQARAIAIHEHHVELDREIPEFGKRIDFEYLMYCAGTTIPAPGRLPTNTKEGGIAMLKKYQQVIKESKKPIIIGAGAVGLELAAEIKEHYPEKDVTLMHSRTRYMPKYMKSFDAMTYNILKKHGVKQLLGDRVALPKQGFPLEVGPVKIQTTSGRTVEGDLAMLCIGMTPNSDLLQEISPKSVDPKSKLVLVKDTMQIQDERYPHFFAAGDVIDHSDVKTGHFAWMQGLAAMHNIRKLINGASYDELDPYVSKGVALIKLYLGKSDAVLQTNALGKLVALGSWVSGRSIPYNIYADAGWTWMGLDSKKDPTVLDM